jgi:hypothetical protein
LLDLYRRQPLRLALIQSHSYRRPVDYTRSGLTDRFVFVLSSKLEVEFIEEEIDSDKVKSLHLIHPYLDHAEWVLYRINAFKTPPAFIIYEKDIPQDVASTFKEIGENATESIITEIVRIILESVNPEYFHVNGIYDKVRWEIEK